MTPIDRAILARLLATPRPGPTYTMRAWRLCRAHNRGELPTRLYAWLMWSLIQQRATWRNN